MFNINKKLSDKKRAYPMNPAERNDYDNLKLLEQVKNELWVNHYKKTEEVYSGLINNNYYATIDKGFYGKFILEKKRKAY